MATELLRAKIVLLREIQKQTPESVSIDDLNLGMLLVKDIDIQGIFDKAKIKEESHEKAND
jgi:hypothetical protein